MDAIQRGIRCKCGSTSTCVVYRRDAPRGLSRRLRRCKGCGAKFHTYEMTSCTLGRLRAAGA